MEFLIELLLELIFEGGIEISSNKKISKWIRYPLIFLIVLTFLSVIIGIFILGLLIFKENIYLSLLMFLISVILLICLFFKFKKLYIEKE